MTTYGFVSPRGLVPHWSYIFRTPICGKEIVLV